VTRIGAIQVADRGSAWFAGLTLSDPVECVELPADADRLRSGLWAVVVEFEGRGRAWRFAGVERREAPEPAGVWSGPPASAWSSSLDRAQFCSGVDDIRGRIRDGDVYQVNLCRLLSAPTPGASEPDAAALVGRLRLANPAPFAGYVHIPAGALPSVWVVSASPELFLRVADGYISSGPIKGTARTPDGLTPKDDAENIMITDMVRNDLQRVCDPGTVEVVSLLERQDHPGLVHLVSTVRGRLSGDLDWDRVLAATFPPASVSGAPKYTALQVISEREPVPRGAYCGAVGWVDGDNGRAELAVGIRSFWWRDGVLNFGTGAGITWGSVPEREWAETELKAAHLVRLASSGGGDGRDG
jgi:para-aminobenzoate synthetase component I